MEEIRKMADARLLAYYKVARKRTFRYIDGFFCGCCGMLNCETMGAKDEEINRDYQLIAEAREYVEIIKAELDTREHVKRKTKNKNKWKKKK